MTKVFPNGQSARVENRLKAQIKVSTRHLVHGFDRLDFLLSSRSPDLDWARLKRHCVDCLVYPHKNQYQRQWPTELRVLQPDRFFPQVLREAVDSRYMMQLQYVEAACDFITKDIERAETVQNLLVEHMLLHHSRRPVIRDRSVFYWAGRTAGVNLAAYADSPSKILSPWVGRPCAHMELRLRGTEALARFGIYGIEDLQHFDHRAAWTLATSFAFVPSRTAMGHVLRHGEDVADDTALRAAAEFLALHAVEGRASLHNAVVAKREIRKALAVVAHQDIFGDDR